MPDNIAKYWPVRHNLYVVDNVILMRDHIVLPPSLREAAVQGCLPGSTPRVVIPASLRKDVIRTLHSAHQGISSMNERAKASESETKLQQL